MPKRVSQVLRPCTYTERKWHLINQFADINDLPDDLFQQAAIALWRALPLLQFNPPSMGTYLNFSKLVARNAMINHLIRWMRYEPMEDMVEGEVPLGKQDGEAYDPSVLSQPFGVMGHDEFMEGFSISAYQLSKMVVEFEKHRLTRKQREVVDLTEQGAHSHSVA